MSCTNVPIDPQQAGIFAAIGHSGGVTILCDDPTGWGSRQADTPRAKGRRRRRRPARAPRAHPDPEPHRMLQRELINLVRPVSVPDNATATPLWVAFDAPTPRTEQIKPEVGNQLLGGSRLAALPARVFEASRCSASLCARGSVPSPLASLRARFARPHYAFTARYARRSRN